MLTGCSVGDVVWTADAMSMVGLFGGSSVDVVFSDGVVDRVTPKGVWIVGAELPPMRKWYSFGTKRWSRTREYALERLLARKIASVRHHERRLGLAKDLLIGVKREVFAAEAARR